jgi:hypothetical protein
MHLVEFLNIATADISRVAVVVHRAFSELMKVGSMITTRRIELNTAVLRCSDRAAHTEVNTTTVSSSDKSERCVTHYMYRYTLLIRAVTAAATTAAAVAAAGGVGAVTAAVAALCARVAV